MTFRVIDLVLKSGERLPTLVDESGIPDFWASTWVLESLRKKGLAANTIALKLRAVKVLYSALPQARDLTPRLLRGEWLAVSEVDHLLDQIALHAKSIKSRREQHGELPVPAIQKVAVIHSENLRSKLRTGQASKVISRTASQRIGFIREFLKYRIDYQIMRLRGQVKADLQFLRNEVDQYIESNAVIIRDETEFAEPKGLTLDQQAVLKAAIHPSSPNNPWKNDPFIRQRNQLLVELFLVCGPRRGGVLGLKVRDIDQHTGRVRMLRRPDDPDDPRPRQPGLKRGEYGITLGPRLMRLLKDYLVLRHKKVRGRHEFLIVSEAGKALDSSTVNNILSALREIPELAGLHPHLLRHTWASNHVRQRHAEGASVAEIETELRSLGGWSVRSEMPSRYTRRYAKESAEKASLRLQSRIPPFRVNNSRNSSGDSDFE